MKKNKMGIGIHIQSLIRQADDQVGFLELYNDELEAKFKRDKDQSHEYHHTEFRQAYNLYDEELINNLILQEVSGIDALIQTFRYSLLINIYSFLEVSLDKLCLIFYKHKKYSLPPSDLGYQGIERSRVYLEKICLIDFPFEGYEWQEILKFNRVRNCIVHTQGNINRTKSPKKVLSIIKNTRGLSARDDREVIIEESYIPNILSNIKRLLDDLYETTRQSLIKSKHE